VVSLRDGVLTGLLKEEEINHEKGYERIGCSLFSGNYCSAYFEYCIGRNLYAQIHLTWSPEKGKSSQRAFG